ncbi:MAG: DNA translocase FtsK [Planctomyces sp.]|nr:DNA translocase FtsK [Planctomyces sp.]
MFNLKRLGTDFLALGLLAAICFVGLSLVTYSPHDPPASIVYPPPDTLTNWGGPIGAHIAHSLLTGLGYGAFYIVLILISTDFRLFSREEHTDSLGRLLGRVITLGALCVALSLYLPEKTPGPVVGSGGYLGAWGKTIAQKEFQPHGIIILLITCLVAGEMLASDLGFVRKPLKLLLLPIYLLLLPFRALKRRAKSSDDKAEAVAVSDENEDVVAESDEEGDDYEDDKEEEEYEEEEEYDDDEEEEYDEDEYESDEEDLAEEPEVRTPIKVNPPIMSRPPRPREMDEIEGSHNEVEDYELPDVELLEDPEDFPYELLAQKAQGAAQTLEKTFQQFGLNVKVSEIDTGPVVTQFELELEAGLRVSKVVALEDDLAIALRVPAVRVVSPIPGKNTVGVEVPNDKQVMVRLKELVQALPEETAQQRIPVFLGKDVTGRPLVVDLTKMPHLLIAGRTGTGKSVCLNTLILSMLMTRSPEQVKMLMIDPKMVELSPYKRVPHLMHPVITDMKKAEAVLSWAVDKMEERYDLLARTGVRHLDSYNKMGKDKILEKMGIDPDSDEAEAIPEQMPYIVIIADEMADMMMTSGKEVEAHIIRLAQKSRAVGIHLVLATQKPTVDVITGLIKSNLPARISFQVASRTDSRVVLDEMGAERLLGNGDMLYLTPGTSNLVRAQGTYVSDEEVNSIIDFYADYAPQYSEELARIGSSGGGSGNLNEMRKRDELYEQAIEVIVREGRGSVSLLQRALGIGYGRGARLIDYMAEDGIVGDYNGSQAREVLYSWEDWEALKNGEPVQQEEYA